MKKPSLTELISLLDKPALLYWANQQGLKGLALNECRKTSTKKGISLHSQIHNYVKNNTPFENILHEISFKNFSKDKEFIKNEFDVECEYFKGRVDSKIKWNNKLYIIDYKGNQDKVYFENKLQLIGYSMCEECDDFAIISTPNFKVLNVEIEDHKPYIEILKSLSIIYQNKKLIEG